MHHSNTRVGVLAGLFALFLALHASGDILVVGGSESKYSTITKAMAAAKRGDTVLVAPGLYRETVSIAPGVVLRAKKHLQSRIVGSGTKKVVSLTNGAGIIGFEIYGGAIGVYSATQGNFIRECLIRANKQSGIMCVGHLPRIEDNIIVYNEGSGIQGWDVRSTVAALSHNTIAYNGNHGVSIGGNSSVALENNILAFNEKMGAKIDPGVKASFRRNCFFGNTEIIESFPSDNFSFDPLFRAPRKMDFHLTKDSRCRNMGTNNDDIGARFTQ